MLKQTLVIVRNNLPFYAIFIAFAVGSAIFEEYSKKSSTTGPTLFLSFLLAMNVQNSVLRNLNFTEAVKAGKLPFGKYLFRAIMLGLLTIALSAPPFLFLLRSGGSGKSYFVLWSLLIFIAAVTVVFSLLGTWLPASIHGTKATFGDALRRGLRRFPSTAVLVFLGFALPLLAGIIALVFAGSLDGADLIVDGHLNLSTVALSIGSNALQSIGLTYIAVVLARRYMEAENIGFPAAELVKVFT